MQLFVNLYNMFTLFLMGWIFDNPSGTSGKHTFFEQHSQVLWKAVLQEIQLIRTNTP